jgi:hypothetical protein
VTVTVSRRRNFQRRPGMSGEGASKRFKFFNNGIGILSFSQYMPNLTRKESVPVKCQSR